MVVGILGAVAIGFLFGGHRETAFTAPDHTGVGESARLARSVGTTEDTLNLLELLDRNHRRMLARIGISTTLKNAGIEGIRENDIHGAQTRRFAANPLPLYGTQPPLVVGDFPDLSWGVGARDHELPHPLNQWKTLVVNHNRFGFFVIQISQGS